MVIHGSILWQMALPNFLNQAIPDPVQDGICQQKWDSATGDCL